MWDSGFLIEVYNYRRAFSERKISLRLPFVVLYCCSIEDLCELS